MPKRRRTQDAPSRQPEQAEQGKAIAPPPSITRMPMMLLETPEQKQEQAITPDITTLSEILSLIDTIDISQQPITKAEIKEAEDQVGKAQRLKNSQEHEENVNFYEQFSASLVSLFNISNKNAQLIQTFDTLNEITRSLDDHIERLSESLQEESTSPSFAPNQEEKLEEELAKELEEENQRLLAKKEELGQLKKVLRKVEAQTDSIERLNQLRSTLIFIYRDNVDNRQGDTDNNLLKAVEDLDHNIQAWFKKGWTTQQAELKAIASISDAKRKAHPPCPPEKVLFFQSYIARLVIEKEGEQYGNSHSAPAEPIF